MRRLFLMAGAGIIAALGLVAVALPQAASAQAQSAFAATAARSVSEGSLGGPYGAVKTIIRGMEQPVDGLMVQLISHRTSIRTTVYTNERGRFEFPRLESGDYVLRVPRPLHFHRYEKDSVRIDGATQLADIHVTRRSEDEFLPPTQDLLDQLTGAEWLFNMPGTAHEKRTFVNTCADSCHGGERPFHVRFDEPSWRLILNRMTNYGHRILTTANPRSAKGQLNADAELLAKWLSRIRGLDSEVPPIIPFDRPKGLATRAIVTEYELPWTLVNIHDVAGDAQGNIYFNINRSPFVGRLDPRTGKVTSWRVPDFKPPVNDPRDRYYPSDYVYETYPPGAHPGLHWIQVDHHTGMVWFTGTWDRTLNVLDPRTGDIQRVFTGMQGNVGLAPDGKSIWRTHQKKIQQFDTATVMKTGRPVKTWDLKRTTSTYGNFLSPDGRYFGGGGGILVWLDIQTGEVREIPLEIPGDKGRGSFDQEGNIWSGSAKLTKYDPKANALTQYEPPTPYFVAYSTKVDKNGEVWSGEQSNGRVFRFNPKTYRWIEYVLPSPWSLDFSSWIDNSTNPPTFWYGDQHGYIVRIQPLE